MHYRAPPAVWRRGMVQLRFRLRSVCVRFSTIAALLVFLTAPSVAWAQPTLNPTLAEFVPSPDQNATLPDGTAIVVSYRLDLFLQGASAPFQSFSLGKPA